jgi:hypothetical protein
VRRKKEKERRKGKREKRKKRQGQFRLSTISIQLVTPFCQTFFKTPPTPSEEPLHQKQPFLVESEPSQTCPSSPLPSFPLNMQHMLVEEMIAKILVAYEFPQTSYETF